MVPDCFTTLRLKEFSPDVPVTPMVTPSPPASVFTVGNGAVVGMATTFCSMAKVTPSGAESIVVIAANGTSAVAIYKLFTLAVAWNGRKNVLVPLITLASKADHGPIVSTLAGPTDVSISNSAKALYKRGRVCEC